MVGDYLCDIRRSRALLVACGLDTGPVEKDASADR